MSATQRCCVATSGVPSGKISGWRQSTIATDDVMTNAKALLSHDMVNVRTGLLRASINYRVVYDGPTMSVFIGSNVDYAGYVHKGTAPHIIRGHGKMLSFYWPKAGTQLVPPFVRHPGTAPRPYLTESLRRSTL